MKLLVIIAQCVNVVATTYIILVKTKVFSYEDPDQEELYMNISIPIALFFQCTAIQVGFTAVVQTAFQDERIFPFSKKATAINIIILVSKAATIGAPFVNEEEEPIPMFVLLGIAFFSIIIVLFFPSKSELDKMRKVSKLTPTGDMDKLE